MSTENVFSTRELLVQTYLDWLNNYLSVETFANNYGLTKSEARALIELCRAVASRAHPEN